MRRITAPIPEVPVRLTANGAPVATWTCSPTALEPLGAGRLLALGFIRDAEDLEDLRPGPATDGVHRIDAVIAADRLDAGLAEREHRRAHGCGLRYLLDCAPEAIPGAAPGAGAEDPGGRRPVPDLDAFPDLFRELFERSPSRQTTGGHHTAALCDGTRLVHVYEEVGRHNGVDKAVGSALLAGDDPGTLGLLTTARISGEIAEKAVRAGVAWVASRSVPTTLAVALAEGRVPLVARAAGSDARVFR